MIIDKLVDIYLNEYNIPICFHPNIIKQIKKDNCIEFVIEWKYKE